MAEKRQRIAADVCQQIDARSSRMVGFFSRIFTAALRKNFHALRVANLPAGPVLLSPQLVVYSNHSSWWDGALFLLVAERLLRHRRAYTPMDAAMLRRYGFFKWIGAFGLDRGCLTAAVNFMEAARLVLCDPRNVLMVTVQGRFADVRERPLRIESGIAHIVKVAPAVVYVPLAIEYTYWLQKRPELLLRFGAPVAGSDIADLSVVAKVAFLEDRLTVAMDQLARDAILRNENSFDVLLTGKSGINPIYDLWRRATALVGNRPYRADHGPDR